MRKLKYDMITGEKIQKPKPAKMVKFDVGCYERVDRKGIKTYYVKIKGRFVKVGVHEVGQVNHWYVKRFRAKLLNESLDSILPRKGTGVLTVADGWVQYRWYLLQKNSQDGINVRPVASKYHRHVHPYIGTKPMNTVTPETIRGLRKKWIESGLSETTQKNIMTLISGIYTINKVRNPISQMDKRDKIHTVNRRHRFLSVMETEALLGTLRNIDKTTYLQACFACYGGLRLKEVLSLTPREIDDPRGILTVRNAKDSYDKGRTRYVQIIPQLWAVIHQYIKPHPDNNKPLFPKFNRKAYQEALNALRLNDDIDPKDQGNRVTFHTLRHSFASHMLESGSNLKEVQVALGHKDIASTMVYSHVSDRQMIEAGGRLSKLHDEADRPEVQLKVVK